jgi:hypothetical protein
MSLGATLKGTSVAAGGEGAEACTLRNSSGCGSIRDRVPTRQFLRIFRNGQGDWCADITDGKQNHVLVFDHHPTVGALAILRSTGTDIADDVVDQGAKGLDMRQRARRAED